MSESLPKVLVVDDLPENLFAMRKTLSTVGVEIFEAQSGNDALSLALRHDFALILLDVQMPGMDGFEVASILWDNEPTRHVPVIFVTAINKEEEYVFKGYESGAVDYLFKPLNPHVLRSKVKVFIELHKRKESLERLNQTLEQRVAQRTADLEAANDDLLLARDAAEAANRAKSTFLASMSHEIRTPMNGVLGMADLLLTTNLAKKQHDYVMTIRRSGDLLLSVINDILDFSKIEAGKMTVESVVFDLHSVVSDVLDLCSEAARAKGLNLSAELDEEFPRAARGDPARMRQVLLNLVSNALKFTRTGFVLVHASLEQQSETAVGVRFEVEDTGIGLSEDQVQKLFQPFVQADASTTRKFGGTGLGLAICKQLTELMGGGIGVHSQPGEGSTFWFTLSLRPASEDELEETLTAQSSVTPAKAAQQLANSRLLVVEDTLVNQRVVGLMLAELRCAAAFADNGRVALDVLANTRFDAILMDCQMPEMDGFEAVRRFREWEVATAAPRTPVIALTANAMQGDRERCFDAGMDDYLSKPLSLDGLASRLCRWIPGKSPGVDSSSEEVPPSRRNGDSPENWVESPGSDSERGSIAATRNGTLTRIDARAHPFDPTHILRVTGGDVEILTEVAGLCFADVDKHMGALHGAIAAGDTRVTERSAHSVKGSLANFEPGGPAVETAFRLERSASELSESDARALFEQLEVEVERVRSEVDALIDARRASDSQSAERADA